MVIGKIKVQEKNDVTNEKMKNRNEKSPYRLSLCL